jgi:hypothetical protein
MVVDRPLDEGLSGFTLVLVKAVSKALRSRHLRALRARLVGNGAAAARQAAAQHGLPACPALRLPGRFTRSAKLPFLHRWHVRARGDCPALGPLIS